ncbi:hypothetical protein GCM10010960_00430 [Arenimonas maotaiensis]|uniref:Uncharacterized protein n=1 Tax=Arenimonas maotaiensis TaxID=1446479 RepID=A0A917CCQ3_9GAMM|nr:hypothetical protein [Arenimonas maotaiensis]GGF82273.1 hypothetical protein GCM10010960_00430 [Arenimonas maotaiensis]
MNMESATLDRRGNTRLWLVFWIYGVLISHLMFGAILYFYHQVGTPSLIALLALFVAYTAWIMHAVWINAFNVQNVVYGQIARALTVAWAINSVMVSGFLLLGHLGSVTLPI